jgi:hypothetical protein
MLAEPVFLFPRAPPLKFPTLLCTSSWIHAVDGPLMDERKISNCAHSVSKSLQMGFRDSTTCNGWDTRKWLHTCLLADPCRIGGSYEFSPSLITLFLSVAPSACPHSLLYGLLFYLPLRLCCHARTRKDVFAVRIREVYVTFAVP